MRLILTLLFLLSALAAGADISGGLGPASLPVRNLNCLAGAYAAHPATPNDRFARAAINPDNGHNTFTALANDGSRLATNTVSVNLPATVSFTYDANGNLTSDSRRGFAYDDENQLLVVTVTNDWKSEFTYDGFMRRRISRDFAWRNSTWVQTSETRYLYDGMRSIQERDGNNVSKVTYTRGLDLSGTFQAAGGIGGLLARTDHSTLTPSHAFYHADGSGNITALLGQQQQLVARYAYAPFGSLLAKAGPLADANTMRFSSKEFHAPSGLSYYGYRFYDPNLQRWLNHDPIGEASGLNLHAFTANSPLGLIDPFGLTTGDPELDAMTSDPLPTVLSPYFPGLETAPLADGISDAASDALSIKCWQEALAHAELTPGPLGEVASGANAILDFAQGNFGQGTLGLASMAVPGPGPHGAALALSNLGKAAKGAATQPNRIYSARELIRRAEEPGPFHNFPESFNQQIFEKGTRTVTPNYFNVPKPGLTQDGVMYQLRGSVNGVNGTFEIGVRPSVSGNTEVIGHRFFRPDP